MSIDNFSYEASQLGLLSRGLLNLLLAHMRRRGMNVEQFVSLAGISKEDTAGENYNLSDLIRYCHLAGEFAGDDLFPMSAGRRMQLSELPIAGTLAMHSPTMKQVTEDMAFFLNKTSKGEFKMTIHYENERGYIRFFPAVGFTDEEFSPLMEMIMVGISYCNFIVANDVAVTDLKAPEVWFKHKPKVNPERVEKLFKVPVKFAQEYNQIDLNESFFDLPLSNYDLNTYNAMKQVMLKKVDEWTKGIPIVEQVKLFLQNTPRPSIFSMNEASTRLNISSSSLQRKLQKAGTTFRDIQTEVIKARAIKLLMETQQPVQDIALSLGYLEIASFHRAFKRWTGLSPGEYRECGGKPY